MLKGSVTISVPVILTLLAIFFSRPSAAVEFSNKYKQWMSFQAHTSLKDLGNLKHEEELAKGKFLVASRKLRDPNFSETVVLLIQYGQGGAMGLVINRASEVKLSTVIPEIKELEQLQDTVHIGGPVAINTLLLLIRSANQPEASTLVFDDVYISSNWTVLKPMFKKPTKEKRFRIYAGYAGWAPKQLEFELNRGDWHVLKADAQMVFDKKHSEVWQELIHRTSVKWVRTKGPMYSKESRFSFRPDSVPASSP
jgi:putative transcriptional regulator